MISEQFSSIPEQQPGQNLVAICRDDVIGWRARLSGIVGASLLVLGLLGIDEAVSPAIAHADSIVYSDLGYPWAGAPCEFGTSGGVSCANPQNPKGDLYDWGEYDAKQVFHPYTSRGYEYRNCTDYVAWKEANAGVAVPNNWYNGGQWYDNAPANEKSSSPAPWDAAVQPPTKSSPDGHAAFVESVNSVDPTDPDGDNITVSEYNYDGKGDGDTRTGKASDMGFTEFVDFGKHPLAAAIPPNPNNDLQMLLTTSSAVYAKTSNGNGGWNIESNDNTVTQIATDGGVQMALASDGEVWARSADTTSGTGAWTKESDAGTAVQIAVSSTGVQMVRAIDNEVWAKQNIGYDGWTGEASAGTAASIAAGGDTQMLITGDGTVYAKKGIGAGGWHQETASGAGAKIAASSTGVQMVQATDGEVWAKQDDVNYGGWTGEASPGTAASIAAGGNIQMLVTVNGIVYARNGVGVNEWQQETDPNVGTVAVVSSNGLQVLRTNDGGVWSKTSVGYGNWTGEASPGTASAVATAG